MLPPILVWHHALWEFSLDMHLTLGLSHRNHSLSLHLCYSLFTVVVGDKLTAGLGEKIMSFMINKVNNGVFCLGHSMPSLVIRAREAYVTV